MREDWVEAYLPEVCDILDNLRKPINSGERSKRIEGKDQNELYPYYGATGQVGWIDDFLTDGDFILIGEDAAPFLDFTKDVAFIISGKTWVNNHAHILKSRFNDLFLCHYLNQFPFQDFVTGTTRLKLTKGAMLRMPIKVAPLPEQRAMVSKIEQLFSAMDSGTANLKKAQAQLKVYRQAVLKKAFEGELTTVEMSLSSIENHSLLVTKGASPKWQGFDYCNDDSQLLFVTSENVREGFLSLEKEKYLPTEFNQIQERSTLQIGDVLFNIVGASIGRAAIFNIDKLANINQAVALIRPDGTILNTYLNYYLNSEAARQAYLAKQVDVARANLSLKDVREIPLPYCTIEEQHQIVQEIESRLSVCDKLEESIAHSLQKAEALRQSILKRAFAGQLLTEEELTACRQEKDWEPAGVLLERIKNANRN